MANSFDLLNKQQQVQKALRESVTLMANNAVNFFKDSFKKQGWMDGTLKLWLKRKRNEKRNSNRAILVKTGRLRRSIRIAKQTALTATIGTDVPYARIHNEGGEITRHARSELFVRNRNKTTKKFRKGVKAGQGFTFKEGKIKMPQRQYMGSSRTLTAQSQKILQKQLSTIFNK